MLAPTLLRAVTVEPLDLPLFEPFVISTGRFAAANNVVVRVELESGIVGLGEASPSLSSGGETQATVLAAAREMVALLPGRDVANWRGLAEFLLANFEAHSCARVAVEAALLDALTNHYQIPLYRWFGGAQSSVETDLTIPIVPTDHARELATEIAARGIRTIKIKVGSGDPAEDEARVVAIHEGAPQVALQLDGNQGYDAPGALRLLANLERQGIIPILFEQPVHRADWDGMVAVTARSPVPIAADECVHTPGDALRVVRERAAHVINIKLMKSTILGALDIVAICRAARLGLMIGGMMESRLGSAVGAHFAAGNGGFGYIDLDTPMLINGDPFIGGYTQDGPRYDLSDVHAGHGVGWR
jgi:L-alanine-DL-glutamate epimerase-like enolase superfamily enzyme